MLRCPMPCLQAIYSTMLNAKPSTSPTLAGGVHMYIGIGIYDAMIYPYAWWDAPCLAQHSCTHRKVLMRP